MIKQIPAEAPSPLVLKLDGHALVENWRALSRLSGRAQAGAAVKANAYGLGVREVVRRLWTAGCRDYFVAHWAEAAEIADLVPAQNIAVLNGVTEGDLSFALELGARPVLNNPQQIARWKAASGGMCNVMMDSGINRLGMGSEQCSPDMFQDLEIDILMSHLASADEDSPQNAAQLQNFLDAGQNIPARRKSLSNSAGIMLGPDYHFDLTRPGISLYGGVPRAELENVVRQVAYPSARILQIRDLEPGQSVGYNATHITQRPTRTATLSIGYADGYYRSFSDIGIWQFNGVELPVIGRVSMDLVVIDCTAAPDLDEGDWVEMDFNLSMASNMSGTSQYELLTGIGRRFKRYWQ